MNTVDINGLVTQVSLIVITIITAISAIQVALINNNRKELKTIKEQLENKHTDNPEKIPNLRENIDQNHAENSEKLDGIIDTQRRQNNKIDRLFSITAKHTEILNKIGEI
jgi:hypothetical protein